MSLQWWLVFLTTVFFLSMTPGPNMLLALSHGMAYGARRAVLTGAGTVLALLILMLVSAAGMGALLQTSELAFQALKWAGAAYLVWLGVKCWMAPPSQVEAKAADRLTPGRQFAQAFLVAMSNPKAIVFFGALFPQFLDPNLPFGPQLLVLTTTTMICEFLWIMIYGGGGARLAPMLARLGEGRLLNRMTGALLIGAAALLAGARRA
ncbi:MAG TPA: LysE family transporter [Alphaproteobacteria bacterium]|nr:LysE family transporter [Alphaproteobacteria bacterium]